MLTLLKRFFIPEKPLRLLSLEVSWALVLKVVLLTLLWYLCFAHLPVISSDKSVLEQHVFAN